MDDFDAGESQLDGEPRRYPTRIAAIQAGCRCEWWGAATIIRFDPDCPILRNHRGSTLPSAEQPFTNRWPRGGTLEELDRAIGAQGRDAPPRATKAPLAAGDKNRTPMTITRLNQLYRTARAKPLRPIPGALRKKPR